MQPNDDMSPATAKRLTLSELLVRALDDDTVADERDNERERSDDDEGAFGG